MPNFCDYDIIVSSVVIGPYYCAEGSLTVALTTCMNIPELIDVNKLVAFAKQAANDGEIDDTSFMESSHVYLISGTKDTTVKQGITLYTLVHRNF